MFQSKTILTYKSLNRIPLSICGYFEYFKAVLLFYQNKFRHKLVKLLRISYIC